MTKDAKNKIDNLSDNQKWLFQHIITAFWHGFGISNGLTVNKEDLEEVHYKTGTPKVVYKVKPEAMRKHLAEYIKWLEQYQESWNNGTYDNDTGDNDFYNQRHESRNAITKMIELLQI